MIAKRIDREKHQKSSPARLIKYMVAAMGGIDPSTWQRTSDYILDVTGDTTNGEKVSSYRVTNCDTEDPADAATLIMATQQRNTRSKKDKTYHLVFSFPPGEEPDLDVLHKIEDELCESIGYSEHQRISAVHKDKDHLHVHVAINKVHPIGFQNIEPFYDKKKLMQACNEIEIKYNLQRTNHGEIISESIIERGEKDGNKVERSESLFRQYLRKSYNLSFGYEPEAKSINSLRTLSSRNMAHLSERTTVLLSSDASSGVQHGRESNVDQLRWSSDGNRTTTKQRVSSKKIYDFECKSGISTLAGYIQTELGDCISNAKSWDELHKAINDHGLVLKKRGAGLVIGEPDLDVWVKASSVNRGYSFNSLERKLGEYKDSAEKKLKKCEFRKPNNVSNLSNSLFEKYKAEKDALIRQRIHGMDAIRKDDFNFKSNLKAWRATERGLIKFSSKGATKKIMYSTIKSQFDAAMINNRNVIKLRRDELHKKTKILSWAEWLKEQAVNGDPSAIAVLRERESRTLKFEGDLLTAERADKAKHVILKAIKPKAHNDGCMSYKTLDGGVVFDRSTHVHAKTATVGAALVALELASKKFEGQPLIVEGSAEFKERVAKLAGMHALKVSFKDPGMEKLRTETLSQKISYEKQRVSDENRTHLERWIKSRNNLRNKVSSIDYHRVWEGADSGKAIYSGKRKIKDGLEVILLKRGDEMLVKPASEAVLAKMAKMKVGSVVSLDSRGRFVSLQRENEI